MSFPTDALATIIDMIRTKEFDTIKAVTAVLEIVRYVASLKEIVGLEVQAEGSTVTIKMAPVSDS